MHTSELITSENYKLVDSISVIIKQDIAIQNAINSLNDLIHINKIQFETGFNSEKKGLNDDILLFVRELHSQLEKAKYGRL